jgi:hypothetical protein
MCNYTVYTNEMHIVQINILTFHFDAFLHVSNSRFGLQQVICVYSYGIVYFHE